MMNILRVLLLALVLAAGGVAAHSPSAQSDPAGDPAGDPTAPAAEPTPEPEITPPPESQGATVTVRLLDNRFMPATVRVAAGTTVIWSNEEPDPTVEHNVISRDFRWASSDFIAGETYEHTFTVPGEYRYFCDLHGGMTGRVIVQ